MRQMRLVVVVFFSLLIGTLPTAHGLTLDLVASPGNIMVGDSFNIDLVVSGLNSVDLSAFDLNVNYDTANLLYSSYVFGNGLGDIASGEAEDWSGGNLGNGLINIGELSYLADLSSQANSFTLATLSFLALSDGDSLLTISDAIFGDAWGDRITVINVNSLKLRIDPRQINPVPEPGTLLFMGIGLIGVGFIHRMHKKRT